jgi:hypothetical protein
MPTSDSAYASAGLRSVGFEPMARDSSDSKPRRSHTSSSRRTIKVKSPSKRRHDKAVDEIATPRPQPNLDELRKTRLEYFSKPPEQRRKTMKYVWDQPISSKTRVMKSESKDKRTTVTSSKSKAGSPEKKKTKRSDTHERDDNSDGERVYVVRPEPKIEVKSRQNSAKVPGNGTDKANVASSPSSKATGSRKPPQRRHTAPAQVLEVDGDKAR